MASHDPKTYRFFLMTIDPVHVGTGGARLGRVDNPIVREPGTNLPKIPGTSLHGVIRAYAAHRYGKPRCAGQGQPGQGKEGHCARPTCPICYTFGYARDQSGGHAGVVAISDARILLFPVYSMVGPVWVSTVNILKTVGIDVKQNGQPVTGDGPFATFSREQPLNLGWLMIETPTEASLEGIPQQWQNESWWQTLRNRIVLVSDKLFSQIVNSNLEVRTSVAINPETGAAEEGALFTYEAIPRATILWMDVVVSDYRGAFPSSNKVTSWEKQIPDDLRMDLPDEFPSDKNREIAQVLTVLREAGFRLPDSIPGEENRRKAFWQAFRASLSGLLQDAQCYTQSSLSWSEALQVLQSGLEWAEHLGVGGMGTRGFGRIRELAWCKVKDDSPLGDPCQKDTHGDTESTEHTEG